MVRINKIYTRTGDDGTTGLGNGQRRLKSDLRIEAFGTVDETNSCIGLARIHTAAEHPQVDAILGRIQNDLFDLGADPSEAHDVSADYADRVRDFQDWITSLAVEMDQPLLLMDAARLTFYAPPVVADPSTLFNIGD